MTQLKLVTNTAILTNNCIPICILILKFKMYVFTILGYIYCISLKFIKFAYIKPPKSYLS